MTLVELIEALMKIDASLGDEPVKVVSESLPAYELLDEVSIESDTGSQHVVLWTKRVG